MKDTRPISLPGCLLLLVFLVFVISFPCLVDADTAVAVAAPASPEHVVTGYLSTRYVYRTAQTPDTRFTDQDWFGELRVDSAAPGDGEYEIHVFGTFRDDLSDNRDTRTFYPLEDIGDTYRSGFHGYLYEANVVLNAPVRSVANIKLGRQSGTRDEPVFFDGIATRIIPFANMGLTLYGGAAVHFYEIGNHWGDDMLAGAGLDYSAGLRTKTSVDYLSVRDDQTYPLDKEQRDRMISLKVWRNFAPFGKGTLKYRHLNSEPRDISIRAVSPFAELDMELNINYFRQFRVQNELSNELSLYSGILGKSSPYHSSDVKLRKLFGTHYAADLGYFNRAVLKETEKSTFDRDYSRLFFLFEISDLPRENLSFTVITEQWSADGQKYHTAGLDAGYSFKQHRNARVGAGTYYSLYKYDYYVEQGLREKVRTYYLNGKYPMGRNTSINGSYEYENGIEDYQALKLGMRYDF